MTDPMTHLRHMADVRPGRDQEAAEWAVTEIERLRLMEMRTLETWAAIGPPSEYAHGVRDAIAMILGEFCPEMP